eukprot:3977704-Pyramimonas_sp.AAC.1
MTLDRACDETITTYDRAQTHMHPRRRRHCPGQHARSGPASARRRLRCGAVASRPAGRRGRGRGAPATAGGPPPDRA